jgi:hypothetical protein
MFLDTHAYSASFMYEGSAKRSPGTCTKFKNSQELASGIRMIDLKEHRIDDTRTTQRLEGIEAAPGRKRQKPV